MTLTLAICCPVIAQAARRPAWNPFGPIMREEIQTAGSQTVSAAGPWDIFGVSEPAVGRDPGVIAPAVTDVGQQGKLQEVHREAVCFRPLIHRPARPLLAGQVHHVIPHLDDASKAIAARLARLPGYVELLGHCRQVGRRR